MSTTVVDLVDPIHVPLCGGYIPPFHLKEVYKYKQFFYQQSQNGYIKAHLLQFLHLQIFENMAVVKNINSMTLAYDGDTGK